MRTPASPVALAVFTLSVCITPALHAQTAYRISVKNTLSSGDVEGQITPYFCFPFIRVTEGDAGSPEPYSPTDAFVTVANPAGNARGFVNHPQNIGISAQFRPDEATLLAELDGDWTVRIEETDGSVYEYAFPMTYTIPFVRLPIMVSDTIEEGAAFVPPFDAQIEGGDANFPGFSSPFRFSMRSDVAGFIEADTLPGPLAFWTPDNGILDGEDSVLIDVIVFGDAEDTTSWNAGTVTPLTPGAPELRLDPVIGTYNASKRARVVRPVATSCAGDFDADNDVDLGDFGVFGAAFGSSQGDGAYNADADFDGDGDVDLGDFGVFGAEFGSGPDDCGV